MNQSPDQHADTARAGETVQELIDRLGEREAYTFIVAQSIQHRLLLQEVLQAPILFKGMEHGQRYHAKALNQPLIAKIRAALLIDGSTDD